MRFGSDAIFSLIMENIGVADDSTWYAKICECIAEDSKLVLRSCNLSKQDIEDITQDVQTTVIKKLNAFCADSKMNTPAQRNSWLRKIINSRLIDFVRKYPRNRELSLDDEAFPEPPDTKNLCDQVLCRVELYGAIKKLGSMNTSPDKAIAFLLTRISSASSGKSGTPALLSEMYAGKTLEYMFDDVEEQLASFLGAPVPEEVLAPLWSKVEPHANELFNMTARRLTDSSSWISEKFRQGREGGIRNG